MNKKPIYIIIAIVVILLFPFVVNSPWTASDYIIASIILGSAGFGLEFVTRKITSRKKKIVLGLGVVLFTMYIWAELAVGIFTNLGS